MVLIHYVFDQVLTSLTSLYQNFYKIVGIFLFITIILNKTRLI
jgi:hypothetical protein